MLPNDDSDGMECEITETVLGEGFRTNKPQSTCLRGRDGLGLSSCPL